MAHTAGCAAPEGNQDRDEWMTVIEMQEYMSCLLYTSAEAEAQAEAARAMIGADMGPDVNSATSPVHGARNRKGCTAVSYTHLLDHAGDAGFTVLGLTYSPIRGPEGNIEYLGYLEKGPRQERTFDLKALVDESHQRCV